MNHTNFPHRTANAAPNRPHHFNTDMSNVRSSTAVTVWRPSSQLRARTIRSAFCLTLAAASLACVLAATTPAAAQGLTGDQIVRDCARGAVSLSLLNWTIAFVSAPFTNGASLLMIPAFDKVIITMFGGCVVAVTGTIVAETAAPSK